HTSALILNTDLYTTILTFSVLPYLFFFTATATPEIYTLSLHDALPIYYRDDYKGQITLFSLEVFEKLAAHFRLTNKSAGELRRKDRKSTRLNSSHSQISYAVFCLKKKKKKKKIY